MLNCNYSDMMVNSNIPMYKSNFYPNDNRSLGNWPYAYPYTQDNANNAVLYNSPLNQLGGNPSPSFNESYPNGIFAQPVAARDLRMVTVNIQDICG